MAHSSNKPFGVRRVLRIGLRVTGAVLLLVLLGGGWIMLDIWSALGKQPAGARLERFEQSPQYKDGRFHNALPRVEPDFFPMLKKWFFESNENREPEEAIVVVERNAQEFATPASVVRVTWMGHSTLLIEVDGKRILTDPVWGDYASPSPMFGVKRFYAPPLALEDLPPIDAVILSHDHYDHLNEPTIRKIKDQIPLFVAPLGLGAHLEYWGVDAGRIVELDWWEEISVGSVRLVCTPSRHFSGRALIDRDATLWSSWAVIGTEERVFFSGDTGMFPGFTEIGERLGPFDITLMESGAYNQQWPDIHMGPEQAVQAHQMVRGKLMLPIHWGTFNLAFHSWTEPAERVLAAAEEAGVQVMVPRPGGSVEMNDGRAVERWWPTLPWQTAAEDPILSPGL